MYILSAFHYLVGADMQSGADSIKIVRLQFAGAIDKAGEAPSESGFVNKTANADTVYFEVVSYTFFNHVLFLPLAACLCPYRKE